MDFSTTSFLKEVSRARTFGFMRDLETMETAITAAETGHLVFSTLHTTGAARTVDRIVDAFPEDSKETVRVQLSTNLKAVISQLLIPRIDQPGRIAAFELMINTPSIAALIRDNKTFRIANDILTGSKYGMVSLDASLANLYVEGWPAWHEFELLGKELAIGDGEVRILHRDELAEGLAEIFDADFGLEAADKKHDQR